MRALLVILVALQSTSAPRPLTYYQAEQAQLMVSADGKTATFLSAARDDLRICVEPSPKVFGPKRCYALRDLRRGDVTPRSKSTHSQKERETR